MADLIPVQPNLLQKRYVTEQGLVLLSGFSCHVRDGVVLKVEPFQSGQVQEGLPFKDEETVVAQVKRFQSENQDTLKTSKRQVAQAVENTEANIGWMSNNYGTIADWLADLAEAKRKHNGRK